MIYQCHRYPELWVGHLKFLDGYLEVTDPADRRAIESSRLYGIHINRVAFSDGEEPENKEEEQPHVLPGRRVTRDAIGRQQTARQRREADKERSDAARAADGAEQAEQHKL